MQPQVVKSFLICIVHVSHFMFHVSVEAGKEDRFPVVEWWRERRVMRGWGGREGGRWGDTRHLSSLQLSVVIDSPADCETLRGQDWDNVIDSCSLMTPPGHSWEWGKQQTTTEIFSWPPYLFPRLLDSSQPIYLWSKCCRRASWDVLFIMNNSLSLSTI